MTTLELWQKAGTIIKRHMDRSPEERWELLIRECGDDIELRRIVESFLLAGRDASLHDFLATSVMGPKHSDRNEMGRGDRVGPYEVLNLIGRGGMGAVYRARRVGEDFDQQVALKVLRRSMLTDEAVRRFRHERQILASLNHPNIARLLDGGATDTGIPFFAMELVEGEPIDEYCDRLKLSVHERLVLFRKVCSAVHVAHQSLVVHRDLKPSNILVSGDGEPKLLDFGIAKPLDPSGPVATVLTREGVQPMTLAYASPEQVEGQVVTTASDVYSLGVILYLLLTGHRPYRVHGSSPFDLAEAIRHEEPERPSAAVLRVTRVERSDGTGRPKTKRDVQIRALRRRLSGDIDSIVLMALRKEPKQRYRSVEQFSEDLRWHLEGQPVAARKPTFMYRARKFMRRNRASVIIAAASLVLILVVGLIYTFRLTRERDRSRLVADEANQVADFLRSMFEISAPIQSRGETITARLLLERGAERVEDELSGQPQLQAEMMTLMGSIYRQLALYGDARPLLERAIALRRQTPGPDQLPLAESLLALARLCEEEGKHTAAQELYEETLAIRESALGPNSIEVASVVDGLGRVLELKGAFEQARRYHERALRISEAELGGDHPEVGRSLLGLGTVLLRLRELETAKARLERALEIFERNFDDDHPYVADTRVLLAGAMRYTGDSAGARAQYERALPSLEQAYGAEHPKVALALASLGKLLNAMRDRELAIAYHRRALTIREKAFGPIHPEVASSFNNLGLTYWGHGNLEQAMACFKRSAEVYEATLDRDHVNVAVPLRNLAEILQYSGELIAAKALYERVLRIREHALGKEHSLLARPLVNLGQLQLELGDPESAEALLRRALAIGRDQEPHRLPEIIWPRIYLGECLVAQARYAEAEEFLAQTFADDAADRIARRRAREALIAMYEAWDRPREAERERRALTELEANVK